MAHDTQFQDTPTLRFTPFARRFAALLAALLVVGLASMALQPTAVLAAQADRNKPITVQADKKVTRYQEGTSVYTGDVVIDQGSLHATGNKATLYLEGGELVRAILQGTPATFRERDEQGNLVEGEALKADYLTAQGEVILTGEAWLTRSGDDIRSERITYNLRNEVIEAGDDSGSSRVEMTLQPRNADSQE